MASQKLTGILWLVAGVSSGGIAFFLDDPLELGIFIGGAGLAVLLALAMIVRPSPAWTTWSNALGAAWLLAFGAVLLMNLSLPVEEVLSVAWILAFGVAAAGVAYSRRQRTTDA